MKLKANFKHLFYFPCEWKNAKILKYSKLYSPLLSGHYKKIVLPKYSLMIVLCIFKETIFNQLLLICYWFRILYNFEWYFITLLI